MAGGGGEVLDESCAAGGVLVVDLENTIDVVREAAPGLDENDSTAVAAFMAPIRDLAAETGCAILLVHHPRKSPAGGEKVDALHAARGSGDLVASVDGCSTFGV